MVRSHCYQWPLVQLRLELVPWPKLDKAFPATASVCCLNKISRPFQSWTYCHVLGLRRSCSRWTCVVATLRRHPAMCITRSVRLWGKSSKPSDSWVEWRAKNRCLMSLLTKQRRNSEDRWLQPDLRSSPDIFFSTGNSRLISCSNVSFLWIPLKFWSLDWLTNLT